MKETESTEQMPKNGQQTQQHLKYLKWNET